MTDSELVALVGAVNEAGRQGNRLYETLAERFRPLVGKQVLKKDGTVMEKYKELLPEMPLMPSLVHICRESSIYSLMWRVRTTAFIPGTSDHQQHSLTVYVARISNGVLTEINDHPRFKVDYDFEEVKEAQAKVKSAKKRLEDAEAELYPFPPW